MVISAAKKFDNMLKRFNYLLLNANYTCRKNHIPDGFDLEACINITCVNPLSKIFISISKQNLIVIELWEVRV